MRPRLIALKNSAYNLINDVKNIAANLLRLEAYLILIGCASFIMGLGTYIGILTLTHSVPVFANAMYAFLASSTAFQASTLSGVFFATVGLLRSLTGSGVLLSAAGLGVMFSFIKAGNTLARLGGSLLKACASIMDVVHDFIALPGVELTEGLRNQGHERLGATYEWLQGTATYLSNYKFDGQPNKAAVDQGVQAPEATPEAGSRSPGLAAAA